MMFLLLITSIILSLCNCLFVATHICQSQFRLFDKLSKFRIEVDRVIVSNDFHQPVDQSEEETPLEDILVDQGMDIRDLLQFQETILKQAKSKINEELENPEKSLEKSKKRAEKSKAIKEEKKRKKELENSIGETLKRLSGTSNDKIIEKKSPIVNSNVNKKPSNALTSIKRVLKSNQDNQKDTDKNA